MLAVRLTAMNGLCSPSNETRLRGGAAVSGAVRSHHLLPGFRKRGGLSATPSPEKPGDLEIGRWKARPAPVHKAGTVGIVLAAA